MTPPYTPLTERVAALFDARAELTRAEVHAALPGFKASSLNVALQKLVKRRKLLQAEDRYTRLAPRDVLDDYRTGRVLDDVEGAHAGS